MKPLFSNTLVTLLLLTGPFATTAAADCGRHHAPPFISGGIGEDERLDMRVVACNYNLRLVFAQSGSGAYLAAVRVRIEDATTHARLINTVANGPFFYASLPPGSYDVRVRYRGQVQERNFVIRDGNTPTSHFYWP